MANGYPAPRMDLSDNDFFGFVADPGPREEPREVRVGWVDFPPSERIPLDAAEEFMEVQMAANVFCRGWLENAYYLLGSDIRGRQRNVTQIGRADPDPRLVGGGARRDLTASRQPRRAARR
ncbi:MAG: hypothetical protein F4087_03465 [Gemmatimonadetes bacterium]|nr:hypothetical protein [Gemmatimonadota bacterium]MYE69084.1 hypothetical protein [Gemmatimonadota bacterium]MYJ67557.1 hypothetical protein [Gemmatimonadota bacterium]